MTWQLLYPNWLDLILPNTVLPFPTQLHQPLSLLSPTLSQYICLITSYHYQIQILFNYVSTQTYTSPCSVYSYCIPEILLFHLQPFFAWPTPSSTLSKQIPTHLNRHTCTNPTFRNVILVITPTYCSLSLFTLSTPPQHSHHVPVPGTIVLPNTIPRYILPTPPSYYHAACRLRPCFFLIISPDSFSIYCLTPRNHYLQYRLGSLPRQPNGTTTFLRNNNQFYPSTIPILSLV